MSLIAYWHIVCRIPLRAIQQMLARLHGLHLSLGGLRGILDAVAERGRPDYAHLKVEIRGSPAVHADESPWRENGSNGYVWACATDAIRYFERHGTRSGSVPRALLGDTFSGVVVCDGYVGYNTLDCRLQRCWVHLLRHGHEITARNPAATRAHAWVRALRALYDAATALVATPGYASRPEATRAKYRLRFEARLMKLAQRVCPTDPKPMVNLAKFLAGKVNECFVFVELPEVAGENNAAERAIRPLVVTRKVCGGTRSAKGSETKMVLASLLHTLLVRQTDPVAAVEQMLLGTPLFAPRA
jgi:transposase